VNRSGKIIGRIAAFYDKRVVRVSKDMPAGGVGFFECIDDQEAANMLFEAGKAWLEEKGLKAMDGPINFGERDQWWGLLVDGFDMPPNFRQNYHLPYYQNLFENFGFKTYFEQYTFARTVNKPISDAMEARAARALQDPDLKFISLDKNDLLKFTEDFRTIYNEAWGNHAGVKKLSSHQARQSMKQMKQIMDPKVMFFGYHKDRPVSFWINLPEINEIFKHVNGNLNWLGKLKFLWHKLTIKDPKLLCLVFGVVPDFQGKGVDAAMIKICHEALLKEGKYQSVELNWIGDFNPPMLKVAEGLEGYIAKTHITYRYQFDQNLEFKRCPIIGRKKWVKPETTEK
jgi:hypothetical protein